MPWLPLVIPLCPSTADYPFLFPSPMIYFLFSISYFITSILLIILFMIYLHLETYTFPRHPYHYLSNLHLSPPMTILPCSQLIKTSPCSQPITNPPYCQPMAIPPWSPPQFIAPLSHHYPLHVVGRSVGRLFVWLSW